MLAHELRQAEEHLGRGRLATKLAEAPVDLGELVLEHLALLSRW
jgi:hypothetical protein